MSQSHHCSLRCDSDCTIGQVSEACECHEVGGITSRLILLGVVAAFVFLTEAANASPDMPALRWPIEPASIAKSLLLAGSSLVVGVVGLVIGFFIVHRLCKRIGLYFGVHMPGTGLLAVPGVRAGSSSPPGGGVTPPGGDTGTTPTLPGTGDTGGGRGHGGGRG